MGEDRVDEQCVTLHPGFDAVCLMFGCYKLVIIITVNIMEQETHHIL